MNKETMMNFNTALIIMLLLLLLLSLARFLFYRDPSNLLEGSFFIVVILALVSLRGSPNLLFWGFLGVILFQGIVILYYYVFNDILLLKDPNNGAKFIFLIVFFAYILLKR
ncbi:MAG: hypothetical protein KKF16_05300 [Euryarchaeota archaeon]|nr:hypothetical protein [Euryarchaeota archaeon]MBU4608603.1 hypothetical protein [Euryarchaeota archaeon]MBV1756190.1 hypothetical protein [Methanobacterium sp.]